ncbi:MAG: cytidine deaminase [Candidatus Limnocylindrales bacterium]
MIKEGIRSATEVVAALPRIGELLEAASVAAGRAHARYSGYPVGAAILDAWGEIHTGCNVESAAFAATICAERGAIAAAVAGGSGGIVACVTVTRDPDPASCCGVCRQLLAEFGPDVLIVNGSLTSDRLRWGTVAVWLPHGFSRASLEGNPASAGSQG